MIDATINATVYNIQAVIEGDTYQLTAAFGAGPTGARGPAGEVTGPGASVNGDLAAWDGTDGSKLKSVSVGSLEFDASQITSGVLNAARVPVIPTPAKDHGTVQGTVTLDYSQGAVHTAALSGLTEFQLANLPGGYSELTLYVDISRHPVAWPPVDEWRERSRSPRYPLYKVTFASLPQGTLSAVIEGLGTPVKQVLSTGFYIRDIWDDPAFRPTPNAAMAQTLSAATNGNGHWVIPGTAGSIKVSDDDGETFSSPITVFASENIAAIAYNPFDQTYMAVGSSQHVSLSTDGGSTWIAKGSRLYAGITGLIATAADQWFAWYTSSSQYEWTADNGATWSVPSGSLGVVARFAVDYSTGHMYGVDNNSPYPLYKSTDAGHSWSSMGVNLNGVFTTDGHIITSSSGSAGWSAYNLDTGVTTNFPSSGNGGKIAVGQGGDAIVLSSYGLLRYVSKGAIFELAIPTGADTNTNILNGMRLV